MVADSGMELQTYVGGSSSICDELEDEVQQQEEQDYGSWEERRWNSWKIGEEIMEEVEEFKYLSVWFNRKLRDNVHWRRW